MIIIIEGPNGVGKTTLCNTLLKEYNLKYIKLPIPKNGVYDYIKWSIQLNNCLIDRFHLGEYVYPILMKDGRIPLTIWQQHLVEYILKLKNTILIYCNTDYNFKLFTFKTRGEDFVNESQIIEESNLFDITFNNSILNKIKVDIIYEKNVLNNILNFIGKIK